MKKSDKIEQIERIVLSHLDYLIANDFKGWDVFDGLKSKIFKHVPLYKNRYFRLAWIQFFKKSPVNFRLVLMVPKEENPKALALFISGLLRLTLYFKNKEYLNIAIDLYNRLDALKTVNKNGIGWGYDFPWQARAFFVPPFLPNMVVSAFVGHTLLDLYVVTRDEHFYRQVEKIAEFILNDLILFEDKNELCFGYVPGEKVVVHNANLLGAGLFSRLYSISKNAMFKDKAEKSVRYSVNAQRHDGAWVYGEKKHHQWVDNFHTGYNLVSIHQYQKHTGDKQFEFALKKGFQFHLKNHYTTDGLPKYTDTKLFPLDIHCFAQSIITLLTLKELLINENELMDKLISNSINLMFDKSKNYFYYQKNKFIFNKISYVRWSQAWMFHALTRYLLVEGSEKNNLD